MINLKIGAALLIAGAALFVLSGTVLGDSEAASYAAFIGLVMFPVGVVLALVGIIQIVIARIRNRMQ